MATPPTESSASATSIGTESSASATSIGTESSASATSIGATEQTTAGGDGDWSGRLRSIAAAFQRLGHELTGAQAATVMEAVTQVAVQRVGGTRWASISLYQGTVVTTAAASDERARRADQIQHELGYGPSVDAVMEDTVYGCGDLAAEPRWPEFGRRVSAELGIHSMLAYRLALDTDEAIGSLNLYSDRRHAFDDEALAVGMLLATHGALAVSAASNRERAHQLQRALETSRDIGVAIGILMQQHKLTRSQAFDLLRIASQNINRKVHDIAVEVADTGVLALPRRMHPGQRREGPR
jgi:ANTAR domain/GAF domain